MLLELNFHLCILTNEKQGEELNMMFYKVSVTMRLDEPGVSEYNHVL